MTESIFWIKQDVTLPLPLALDQLLAFIRRNTSMRAEIKEIRRKDIPQYPTTAVREALLNALVHADYAVSGAHIQVALFRDRMEITNPGSLPFGLRLETALSGISQLRNRVIGRVFRELGMIEQWGSGLRRMQEACEAEGLPMPKFEEADHFFRVTLYHRPERKRVVETWQKPIVDFLLRHKEITVKDAEELWETSRRTARTRLKKMVEVGMLVELSTGPYDPRKSFILKIYMH